MVKAMKYSSTVFFSSAVGNSVIQKRDIHTCILSTQSSGCFGDCLNVTTDWIKKKSYMSD